MAINTSGQAVFAVSAVCAGCLALPYLVRARKFQEMHRCAVFMIACATVVCSIAATLCPERSLSATAVVVQTVAYFWGRGMVACWVMVYAASNDAELFGRSGPPVFGVPNWVVGTLSTLLPLVAALGITIHPGVRMGTPHIDCFLSGGVSAGDIYIKLVLPALCLVVLLVVVGRRLMLHTPAASDADDAGPNEETALLLPVPAAAKNLGETSANVQAAQPGEGSDPKQPAAAFRHTAYLTLEVLAQTLILINYTFSVLLRAGSVPQLEVRFLDVTFHASRGIILLLCFGGDVWRPVLERAQPWLIRLQQTLRRGKTVHYTDADAWAFETDTDAVVVDA